MAAEAEKEVIMDFFVFLAIVVVVQGTSRVVVRWLRTRDGVSQRQIKELEQRIHILEAQHVQDLQKRLGVLEEIFVTEDITLQRKIRHALSGDSLTPPRTENQYKT
jgi:hypothetical protein